MAGNRNWRTSSYSAGNGECVQAASWRTCAGGQRSAAAQHVVGVRDSQLGDDSPVLEFGAGAWRDFIRLVRQ